MTKLVVDQIQRPSGATIELPSASPTGNQYLQTDGAGLLSFTNQSTVTGIDAAPAGSVPFIFAVQASYMSGNSGAGGISSELGDFSANTEANRRIAFAIATGRHPYGRLNGPGYANYQIPPMVSYAMGGRSTAFMRHQQTYGETSTRYNYPDKIYSVIFFKNPTASSITATIGARGSAYAGASYDGQSVSQFTPNAITSPTSLTYTNLWTYQSTATSASTTFSITVAAGYTVALVYYSSYRNYANPSQYCFYGANGFYDLNVAFAAGLVIDIPRTFKAISNPNRSGAVTSAGLAEIWS